MQLILFTQRFVTFHQQSFMSIQQVIIKYLPFKFTIVLIKRLYLVFTRCIVHSEIVFKMLKNPRFKIVYLQRLDYKRQPITIPAHTQFISSISENHVRKLKTFFKSNSLMNINNTDKMEKSTPLLRYQTKRIPNYRYKTG